MPRTRRREAHARGTAVCQATRRRRRSIDPILLISFIVLYAPSVSFQTSKMSTFSRKSALAAAAIVAATATSTTAFSPVVSRTATPSGGNALAPRSTPTSLRMSADDEVAKLRAAAQKAREEAQALAKVWG